MSMMAKYGRRGEKSAFGAGRGGINGSKRPGGVAAPAVKLGGVINNVVAAAVAANGDRPRVSIVFICGMRRHQAKWRAMASKKWR